MAVYVDRLHHHEPRDEETRRAGRQHKQQWCHMWADVEAELILMGIIIGMKQRWLQDHNGFVHFDLTPTRRAKAVRLGAVELSLKAWFRRQRLEADLTQGPE